MNDLRPFFKHGIAVSAAIILFQGIAAMALMDLPPIRIYLYSSLLAAVLIGAGWLLRRAVRAKQNSRGQHSEGQQ
jgi:membrane protein implicated in regulation of membrane protease activity